MEEPRIRATMRVVLPDGSVDTVQMVSRDSVMVGTDNDIRWFQLREVRAVEP